MSKLLYISFVPCSIFQEYSKNLYEYLDALSWKNQRQFSNHFTVLIRLVWWPHSLHFQTQLFTCGLTSLLKRLIYMSFPLDQFNCISLKTTSGQVPREVCTFMYICFKRTIAFLMENQIQSTISPHVSVCIQVSYIMFLFSFISTFNNGTHLWTSLYTHICFQVITRVPLLHVWNKGVWFQNCYWLLTTQMISLPLLFLH